MNVESRIEAPRYVSAQEMDRLSDWANRKPVIALMGEFSSGKSTLLNMLVGQSILPMQVTATRLPPVWIQYGDKPAFWMDKEGQRHAVDLDNLDLVPLNEARFIRIYVLADQLKKCDLIDTPGISDPNIPTDSWIKTIEYANSVLWCTHAGQAWRESERSQWESLPDRLRENSLLLVTRADKIVSRTDLDKIHRRLVRETGNLFSKHHFISLTMALKSREEDSDPGLWVKSGGEVFMDSLGTILSTIISERNTLLRRYRIVKGSVTIASDAGTPTTGNQDSISEADEAPVDTVESNISVLRPRRVQSATSARKTARLNMDDAANIRNNLLSDLPPAEKGEDVETTAPNADTELMAPLDESPADDIQIPSEGAVVAELLNDEIVFKDNSVSQATDETSDAPSDITPESNFDQDATTEDDNVGQTTEFEDENAAIKSVVLASTDGVETTAPETDTEPKASLDEGSADDFQTSSERAVEEEPLDEEIVAEDDVVSHATDETSDAPPGIKPEPNFDRVKSASEIWQEILSTGEIETVPQMLEAVSLLLEQLDEKDIGFQAA